MIYLCTIFGLLIGFLIGEQIGYDRHLKHERKRPVSIPIESID